MQFVALDVETANADMASICQIGIARFVGGELADEWSSLVNPEDYFHPINIGIHGISEPDVAGCPTFPELAETLRHFLDETVCVSHTHFDRVSISRALTKYRMEGWGTVWLDSARVARRTWEDCAWRDFGLANVCAKIGYRFRHHDALEDAKASAEVLLAAMQVTGLDLEAWLRRVEKPIDPTKTSSGFPSRGAALRREGDPEGQLYGEVVAFTGALEIPRREAADLAASIGCAVAPGVTRKTTLLVVGDQDVSKLGGKNKSSKHLKAEELILGGQEIRIVKESDFKELVKYAHR